MVEYGSGRKRLSRVTKEATKTRTTVRIALLTDQERKDEIARLLSGATVTAQAAAHAEEMLRRSNGGDWAFWLAFESLLDYPGGFSGIVAGTASAPATWHLGGVQHRCSIFQPSSREATSSFLMRHSPTG